MTADIAQQSCNLPPIPDFQSIENGSSESKRQLYRVTHAAKTLQAYDERIDPAKIQQSIEIAGTVAKYATVAGTYKEYRDTSCAFNVSKPETVEDYYIATASLSVELAMLQYGVSYKVASKATRMASHTATFRMVQSRFGNDALRILMSETHWAVRGQVAGVQATVASELDQRNITMRNSSVNETAFRKYLNETGRSINRTALNESINESSKVVNEAVNQSNEFVNNTSKEELVNETVNKTQETNEELLELWNESDGEEKLGCLDSVGGSLATKLLEQLANPLASLKPSDLLNLSELNQQKLKECLSND